MRVLISGVIGAIAAVAAWKGIEFASAKEFSWLAMAVGVVTGWSVHKAAGPNAGGGYARGGLAALLSLAGIVGGQQVYAKVMEAMNDPAEPVSVVSMEDSVEEEATEETTSTDSTPVEVEELEERSFGGSAGSATSMPMKKRLSEMEMVWMCGAALLAYLVGKGPDPVPVDEEGEASDGDSEAAAEQSEGDSADSE